MTTPRPRGPSAEALSARRVVDLLELRAAEKPDEVVYTYLLDDGAGERTLTYGQLYDDPTLGQPGYKGGYGGTCFWITTESRQRFGVNSRRRFIDRGSRERSSRSAIWTR